LLDPGEAHNLADSPSHGEVLATMRARLEDWMRSTDDPILDGDVPAPVGAEINLPSQGSSREPRVFIAEDGSYVDSPPVIEERSAELDEAEAVRGQIR
jgi:hypothetical protein